jgi:hypothetical protein
VIRIYRSKGEVTVASTVDLQIGCIQILDITIFVDDATRQAEGR